MDTIEMHQIQRLLDLLEDQKLILKRMEISCLQLEKELRIRLNPTFEVIP